MAALTAGVVDRAGEQTPGGTALNGAETSGPPKSIKMRAVAAVKLVAARMERGALRRAVHL